MQVRVGYFRITAGQRHQVDDFKKISSWAVILFALMVVVDGVCARRQDDRLRGLRRTSCDRPQRGLPSEAKGPVSQAVVAARSPRARLLGSLRSRRGRPR